MHLVMLADLAPDGHPSGGVQHAVVTLAEGLSEAGVHVTMLAPDAGNGNDASDIPTSEMPFDLVRVPMDGRGQLLHGFARYGKAVRTAIEDLRPDIVHAHGLLHNGVAASRIDRTPVVLTAHGDPLADAAAHYPEPATLALKPFLVRAVKTSIRGADRVVNVTPEWRVNLPEPPRHIVHIPNPIEPLFFKAACVSEAEKIARRTRQKRVLFFGGDRKIKGADILAKAWPVVHDAYPGAKLIAFGVGGHIAERLGALSGSILCDTLPSRQVAKEMSQAAVVVIPSRYEVSPLLIPEAWTKMVPVVATAVGGVPAMAKGAALLCKPEPASLAGALVRALTGGPEVEALAREGVARARLHNPDMVCNAHLSLYEELLGMNEQI